MSFQKPAKPCGKTERKLSETPNFGEMCVKSTQSKRGRKRSDEKSTCGAVENSDLSTAKSTGCGKVEISTQVFNRVWKTVLIIYICRKLPLWKRQWETFGKGCKAFFSRKSEAIFFSLDYERCLRNCIWGSLTLDSSEKKSGKTAVFQINYIDCGRGLLLRGGAHRTNFVSSRDIRRRLLVNLRSRFRWSYTVLYWCRPFEPISRAATHKP